jgi:hypothetical protein
MQVPRPRALRMLNAPLRFFTLARILGPEPRRPIVFFVPSPQSLPFPINQEPRKSHGELGKQIVIGDREREMIAMPMSRVGKRVFHVMRSVISF